MPAEIEGIFIPLFSHSRQGHENGSVCSKGEGGHGEKCERGPEQIQVEL